MWLYIYCYILSRCVTSYCVLSEIAIYVELWIMLNRVNPNIKPTAQRTLGTRLHLLQIRIKESADYRTTLFQRNE